MANQRKFTKVQVVYDKPRKKLVGTYLTAKGKKLLKEGMPKKEVQAKYQKNKYELTDAKPIKTIIHPINHRRIK